jgi:hypothetical protein
MHFDANPYPDLTFHFDTDPDPDPDPSPSVAHVGKSKFFFFIHSSASLHYFIFLAIVIGVIIFNILDCIIETFWKIVKFSFSFEMETDPYPAWDR